MKKEYLKPTARSHELRCRSMVAQSPQPLESHTMPFGDLDDDDDPPIYAD